MFEWKHPNYYKKIKKESRLTNQSNDDKENHRRNSNNTIRQRTNTRDTRK